MSNNKGDQEYLKYYTGINSELIPRLCLYTNAKYTGTTQGFYAKERMGLDLNKIFKSNLIQNNKLPGNYKWQELYNFQGIVHFPYQISTMSLFEQYSANVPLFFPTKDFLMKLHNEYPSAILSELSFFQVMPGSPPTEEHNPDNFYNKNIVKKWIDYADFYDEENMPYIQYFDSFSELKNLLEFSDLKLISENMKEYNKKRKSAVFKKWEAILKEVQNNL